MRVRRESITSKGAVQRLPPCNSLDARSRDSRPGVTMSDHDPRQCPGRALFAGEWAVVTFLTFGRCDDREQSLYVMLGTTDIDQAPVATSQPVEPGLRLIDPGLIGDRR